VYRDWFNIFLIGCHARMGDEKRPDQDMHIEVILEVQATLERDLFNSQTVEQMIRVCVHAVFIICGFCAGLRGEELPMMSMYAMTKHYKNDQPVEGSLENVFLVLRGRVKGEHSGDVCHLIPIAATTETGLKPRLWVGRMIEAYRMEGIADGWVFRNESGAPGRQSDYEPYFFDMAQNFQASGAVATRVLDQEDDVPTIYGLSRSLRRRYATHATNMGVADAGQKRLARWRYVESADGRTPNFQGGTKENYSDINLMLKTLLRATHKL
jgi:hypothetical protein